MEGAKALLQKAWGRVQGSLEAHPGRKQAAVAIAVSAGALIIRWVYKGRKGTASQRLPKATKAPTPATFDMLTGVFPTHEKLVCHHGSCHCGAVRFTMRAPPDMNAIECNCSFCEKQGKTPHLVVPAHCLDFEGGVDALSRYSFGSNVGKHMFCATCGVEVLRLPRMNPHAYSVNMSTVSMDTVRSLHVHTFNGANYDAAMRAATAAQPPTADSVPVSPVKPAAASKDVPFSSLPQQATVPSAPASSVTAASDEESFMAATVLGAAGPRRTPPGVPVGATYSGQAHRLLAADPPPPPSKPAPTPVIAMAASGTSRGASPPSQPSRRMEPPRRMEPTPRPRVTVDDAPPPPPSMQPKQRATNSLPLHHAMEPPVSPQPTTATYDSSDSEDMDPVHEPSSYVAMALRRDPPLNWRFNTAEAAPSVPGAGGPGAYRTAPPQRTPAPKSSTATNLWSTSSTASSTARPYVSAGGSNARLVPRRQTLAPIPSEDPVQVLFPQHSSPPEAAEPPAPARSQAWSPPRHPGSSSASALPVPPRPVTLARSSSQPSSGTFLPTAPLPAAARQPSPPTAASLMGLPANGATPGGMAPPYSPYHHVPGATARHKPSRRATRAVTPVVDAVKLTPERTMAAAVAEAPAAAAAANVPSPASGGTPAASSNMDSKPASTIGDGPSRQRPNRRRRKAHDDDASGKAPPAFSGQAPATAVAPAT